MNKVFRILEVIGCLIFLVISGACIGYTWSHIKHVDMNDKIMYVEAPAVVLNYSYDDIDEMMTNIEESMELYSDLVQADDVQNYTAAKKAYKNNPTTISSTQLFDFIVQIYRNILNARLSNALEKAN